MAEIREISHFPDDVIIHDVTFFDMTKFAPLDLCIARITPMRKTANTVVSLHLF